MMISGTLLDLIHRMLEKNSSERITIQEIYHHQWLYGHKMPSISVNEEELSVEIAKEYTILGIPVDEDSVSHKIIQHDCYIKLLYQIHSPLFKLKAENIGCPKLYKPKTFAALKNSRLVINRPEKVVIHNRQRFVRGKMHFRVKSN